MAIDIVSVAATHTVPTETRHQTALGCAAGVVVVAVLFVDATAAPLSRVSYFQRDLQKDGIFCLFLAHLFLR